MTRVFILAGPPASGKGTQCEKLVEQYGFVHISTGDLLRAQQKTNPSLAEYMNSGALVPDEMVISVVAERLGRADVATKGALLDGFPRTLAQAQELATKVKVTSFISLEVADEVVVARISGRRSDPETGKVYHMQFKPPPAEIVDRLITRGDDTEEKIKVRLGNFHKNNSSLQTFYASKLCQVECGADSTPEGVYERVQAEVERLQSKM